MTLTLSLRPDVTVVVVLLPSYAKEPWLMETEFPKVGYYDPTRTLDGNMWSESIDLPPGQYEIVGLLGPQNERALRKLPDKWEELGIECFRATGQTQWYYTARECIREAIHSAGGDPEANWLLIKTIQ